MRQVGPKVCAVNSTSTPLMAMLDTWSRARRGRPRPRACRRRKAPWPAEAVAVDGVHFVVAECALAEGPHDPGTVAGPRVRLRRWVRRASQRESSSARTHET